MGKAAPRGQRSSRQKGRKAKRLEKALASAEKQDARVAAMHASQAQKKGVKALWVSEGAKP